MDSQHKAAQQSTQPAYFNWWGLRWAGVIWLCTLIVTGLGSYFAAYGSYDRRISVLESRMSETDRRLERIEAKIDQLLSRTP
jgi:hypothetical protein